MLTWWLANAESVSWRAGTGAPSFLLAVGWRLLSGSRGGLQLPAVMG